MIAASTVFYQIVSDPEQRQQVQSRMLAVLVGIDALSGLFNFLAFALIKFPATALAGNYLSLVGQLLLFSSFTWTAALAYHLQYTLRMPAPTFKEKYFLVTALR